VDLKQSYCLVNHVSYILYIPFHLAKLWQQSKGLHGKSSGSKNLRKRVRKHDDFVVGTLVCIGYQFDVMV
jgi:hypothetical protein